MEILGRLTFVKLRSQNIWRNDDSFLKIMNNVKLQIQETQGMVGRINITGTPRHIILKSSEKQRSKENLEGGRQRKKKHIAFT